MSYLKCQLTAVCTLLIGPLVSFTFNIQERKTERIICLSAMNETDGNCQLREDLDLAYQWNMKALMKRLSSLRGKKGLNEREQKLVEKADERQRKCQQAISCTSFAHSKCTVCMLSLWVVSRHLIFT